MLTVSIVCLNDEHPKSIISSFQSDVFEAALRAADISKGYLGTVEIRSLGRTWVTLFGGRVIDVAAQPSGVRSYDLDMIHEMTMESELINAERFPSKFPLKLEVLQRR